LHSAQAHTSAESSEFDFISNMIMPHPITLEENFFLILMRKKKHVEAKANENGCTYNKGEEKKIHKLTPFFLVCMCCEPLFGFCLGVSIIWAMGVLYRKWPSSFWSPRIYVCVIFAICWGFVELYRLSLAAV
jgi:hypothetical protein